MPEIFRLTLPREVTPAFPDYCIVCGRPEHGHQASLFAAEMRHGHSFRESYSLKVPCCVGCAVRLHMRRLVRDRKSTRLNSSHSQISYAVFCLKKKTRKSSRCLTSLPH